MHVLAFSVLHEQSTANIQWVEQSKTRNGRHRQATAARSIVYVAERQQQNTRKTGIHFACSILRCGVFARRFVVRRCLSSGAAVQISVIHRARYNRRIKEKEEIAENKTCLHVNFRLFPLASDFPRATFSSLFLLCQPMRVLFQLRVPIYFHSLSLSLSSFFRLRFVGVENVNCKLI